MQTYDCCLTQCFVGYYLLINILTTIHRDTKNPPDGWVAIDALGNYQGAYLCIPDIGISSPYQEGDVVFFRSWALKHFVRHFQGERYVVLFSTSQSIFEWLNIIT
jgi:hypothetical protein